MARSYSEDTVDVFRQKVTRRGIHKYRPGWGYEPHADQPYERVTFYGPYRTRNMGGEPYLNYGDTEVVIEVQKLVATHEGGLQWDTEKKKVIRNEEAE